MTRHLADEIIEIIPKIDSMQLTNRTSVLSLEDVSSPAKLSHWGQTSNAWLHALCRGLFYTRHIMQQSKGKMPMKHG
ncbi:MAG: hypothetical protein K6F94_08020 [Bacteroidaceae bacterium]|nr:hypothetical protein [Bacteroidaceae bacterium]